jgi:D-alanine-D-alanine ligase-like ATP-grasp enzyme
VYIGIDIAIDKNNRLWLIEANSLPGFEHILKNGNDKVIIDSYIKILDDLKDNKS